MIIDPRKIDERLIIDDVKLAENTQYQASRTKYPPLDDTDIIDTLDAAMLGAVNNSQRFVKMLYWIIAYQSYYSDYSDLTNIPYGGISSMLTYGNPRLSRLQIVLDAFDSSLAVCSLAEHEERDYERIGLHGGVFQPPSRARDWSYKDVIEIFSLLKLRLRIISKDEAKTVEPLALYKAEVRYKTTDRSLANDLKRAVDVLQSFGLNADSEAEHLTIREFTIRSS